MVKYRKVGGRRNFGYGRSLKFAARSALCDGYGNGRFGTRAAYASKVNGFIAFMRNHEVRDFREVTGDLLREYAESLREQVQRGELSISYAVGCVSAVNCILRIMRGDKKVWISPRVHVGRREFRRVEAPATVDFSLVESAACHLESSGEIRLAGLLRLCGLFGLRHREASLLDVKRAAREARRTGEMTVDRGTKGGRPRTVSVGKVGIAVLEHLTELLAPAVKIVPDGWTTKRWHNFCGRSWTKHAKRLGTDHRIREFRTGAACRLYEEITGVPAPVFTGGRTIPRELDRRARTMISKELGHGREQICGAYVGTSRSAPK